jgi:hypothetical protein
MLRVLFVASKRVEAAALLGLLVGARVMTLVSVRIEVLVATVVVVALGDGWTHSVVQIVIVDLRVTTVRERDDGDEMGLVPMLVTTGGDVVEQM